VACSDRRSRSIPAPRRVYYGQLSLARKGDEATAVRFTVQRDGTVGQINALPKKLVHGV